MASPMRYSSLRDLSSALRDKLAISAIFTSVNTRLILQTGVNLKSIDPAKDADAESIRKVEAALIKMGISLGGR